MKLPSFTNIFSAPVTVPQIHVYSPINVTPDATPSKHPHQNATPSVTLDNKKLSATKTQLFHRLPPELNLQISNHAAEGSGLEALQNLTAILNINKTFKSLMTENKNLWAQYRSLNALAPKANSIPESEFSNTGNSKILDLLRPKKRRAIVAFSLANKNPEYRTSMTTWLASGLSHLDDPDRNAVVDVILFEHQKINATGPQVVSFESTTHLHPSKALAELCKSFHHLDTAQRQRVIHAVLVLPYGELKARLIGNLGEAMSHMDDTQRTSVVNAYLQLPGGFKHFALAGFATAIAQGKIEKHRDSVVKDIVGIEDASAQGKAIGAFGPALKHLSEPQLANLGEHLTNMEDEPKSVAVGELGPAIGHLNKTHRGKLFRNVLVMENGNKIQALIGLTQALGTGSLSEDMTKYILSLTKHPHEKIRAIILSNMGTTIARMDKSERPKFVEATLQLKDLGYKGMVLENMGSALPSLDPVDGRRLVSAFLDLHDDEHTYKVLRGFSQSLKYVSKNQIPDVINTVLAMEDNRWKSLALAELGPMRDSLNDAQWNQLTDTADAFEGVDGAVFKATALSGLHR